MFNTNNSIILHNVDFDRAFLHVYIVVSFGRKTISVSRLSANFSANSLPVTDHQNTGVPSQTVTDILMFSSFDDGRISTF